MSIEKFCCGLRWRVSSRYAEFNRAQAWTSRSRPSARLPRPRVVMAMSLAWPVRGRRFGGRGGARLGYSVSLNFQHLFEYFCNMKPKKRNDVTIHRDNTTFCMTHHHHTSKQARAGALMAHHLAWMSHHTGGSPSTPTIHPCGWLNLTTTTTRRKSQTQRCDSMGAEHPNNFEQAVVPSRDVLFHAR